MACFRGDQFFGFSLISGGLVIAWFFRFSFAWFGVVVLMLTIRAIPQCYVIRFFKNLPAALILRAKYSLHSVLGVLGKSI